MALSSESVLVCAIPRLWFNITETHPLSFLVLFFLKTKL